MPLSILFFAFSSELYIGLLFSSYLTSDVVTPFKTSSLYIYMMCASLLESDNLCNLLFSLFYVLIV